MLSIYTNQQDLLKATSEVAVSRIDSVDTELLQLDIEQYAVTFEDRNDLPDLELHVYTPDGLYLTGNHKINYSVEKNDTTSNLVALQHLSIDIPKVFGDLGITRGQYKVVYNLFDNILGSYEGLKLWIKEISPSRRELRLQLSSEAHELKLQLDAFQKRWNLLSEDDRFDSFVLNFGGNETFQIINVRFETEFTDTPEVLIKLYNPLPAKYGEKSKVWISEELITPVLDSVILVPKFIPEPVTKLAPANFEIEEFEGSSVATDFKTWNDLLSTNLQTSQQIIDSQFSGSLSGIKLNINYRIFDNFVHYGSAAERVKNFKYKLELIEHYTDRIDSLSSVADQGIVQVNLTDVYTKRNRVVSGFDDFEKYLFFESSGSKLYTHYDEVSGSRTIEPINPWPKTNPTNLLWTEAYQLWSSMVTEWKVGAAPDPYGYFSVQSRTDSTEAKSYYNALLETAEVYDKNNVHKLQSTIPYHIQSNEDNEDFLLFVHMLGQHFDILWTYINHLSSIKSREEHPKDGMPDELLYHVAASLGFDLLNGKSAAELWRYNLSTDSYGNVIKNEQGLITLSDKQITREIWRRIVNNLPYILKTKGTSRSIKAMVNCFGIPLTVLTIKEYGGPSTFTNGDHYPEYVHDLFHYAWFSNSATGSLQTTIGQYLNGKKETVPANTLEFRFKTDNNFDYYQNNYYNIASISSGSVSDVYNLILSKESADDEEGTLTLFNRITGNAISASNLEIFDNNWNLITIESTAATSSFKLVKSLYGKTIYIKSASFYGETIFPEIGNSTLTFTSGSRSIEKYSGSYFTTSSIIYTGSALISNGLVMNLDAGNVNSYPGSGSVWNDLTNTYTNISLVADPVYSSIGSGSILFNPDIDYQHVSLGFISTVTPGKTEFTYNIACNFDASMGGQALFSTGTDFDTGNDILFAHDGTSFFFQINSSGDGSAVITDYTYTYNTWINVCVVYDGAQTLDEDKLKVYIDGVQRTLDFSDFSNIGGVPSTTTLYDQESYIGKYMYGGWEFRGYIAMAQLYNRALTASEVISNYNSIKSRFGLILSYDTSDVNSYSGSGTTVYDLTGYGNVGELSGDYTYESINGGVIDLGGNSATIAINNTGNITPPKITLETWVKPSDISTQRELFRMESNVLPIYLFSFQESNIISFGLNTSISGYNELDVTLDPNDVVEKWCHFVATYESGSKKLYLNGALIGEAYDEGTINFESSSPAHVGSSSGVFEFLDGKIGLFNMYNYSLTPTEVLNRYNITKSRFGIIDPLYTEVIATSPFELSKFYGHFQEVRLWSGSLNNSVLEEHAASPNTYTYNTDLNASTTGEESAKPYEHLLQRFTLSTKAILSGSFYQNSVHPNQTINTGSLYYIGYDVSGSITFEGFEETYYTPSPSLGGSSLYSNKIRFESSSLDPNRRLNTKTRIEKSSLDQYSVDSNRLGVYFSPQTAINEDIFNQIGYFEIDDYIGDPRSDYERNYPLYDNFAINYWKKYENKNDFEAYFRALEIYDFTVFKYIKKLLPERVNGIVGLAVENNVLNRSKVKFLRNKPSIQELSKNALIDVEIVTPLAETVDIKAVIDEEFIKPNAVIQDIKGLIDEDIIAPKAEIKNIKGVIDQEIIIPTSETKDIKGVIDSDVTPKPVAETKDIKGTVDGNVLPETTAETKDIKAIVDSNVVPETSAETKDIKAIIDSNVTPEASGLIKDIDAIIDSDVTPITNGIVSENLTAAFDMEYMTAESEFNSTLLSELTAPIEWMFPEAATIQQNTGEIQEKIARAAGDILSIDRGDILGAINTDRLGTTWLEKKITGRFIYTQTGSYTPIQTQVYASRTSKYQLTPVYFYSSEASASLKMPSSQSLVPAEVNNDYGPGYTNLKWAGSKLTGPGINIDTPNTIDGGPVVKITQVNPNQIVFANNQVTTIDETRTGNRKKSI